MYNVKYKQFLGSELLVYYNRPINDDDDTDKRKVVPTTGEICPSNRRIEWNPFENDYEIMYTIHDDDSGLQRSLRRTRQAVYDIAQSNDWEYFFTLTFNPEKVDSFDYDATVKKLSNWLNNMKKIAANMRYIVVPEQHKSGRWHFHGLFMNCDNLGFVDSEKRTDKGQIIYNVGKYKFGFSTAIELDSSKAICTYLTKYITKDVCANSKGKKRYWASRNCNKPIEYKFFMECGEKGFDELGTAESYRKVSENAHQKVIYETLQIYTTNTMRFNTSEVEVFPPHIELRNTETSEDNNKD